MVGRPHRVLLSSTVRYHLAFKSPLTPNRERRKNVTSLSFLRCLTTVPAAGRVNMPSSIKGRRAREIIPFTAMLMDLEIIILSEVSQTERDRYHMILLICET